MLVVGGTNLNLNKFIIITSCHTDVRLTDHVQQTGKNKQLILNCSVTGIHNISNVVEFRFNDEKSYSCTKTGWPNEPEGNTDKPYVQLMDNTTCQLIIPNAAKADFTDYYCRVKLALSRESADHTCHLLSETITPSDSDENSISILVIGIVVPVTMVIIIIATIVMVSIVLVRKKCGQGNVIIYQPDHPLQIPKVNYEPPGVRLGNFRNIHCIVYVLKCTYTTYFMTHS